MDQRELSRALRRSVWPELRSAGFSERTERAAWRQENGHADVVEVTTVGQLAESVGATSVSMSAYVASVPAWLQPPRGVGVRAGRTAPHYWQTPLHRQLIKTLVQPWFQPFRQHVPGKLLPSLALHREGLRAVIRADVHDRPDVWFVLEDGSNLDQVLADLVTVIRSVGLSTLEAYRDPGSVIRMVRAGELRMTPDSPAAAELIAQAQRQISS